VNETTVALALLLVVLGIAAFSTRLVAIAASLIAFACFNLFFLAPVGTFAIARTEDALALFALLAVSLIGSHLSQQARRSAAQALAAAHDQQEAEIARLSAETKAALVASFSHELKTPLTALTVAADNVAAPGLSDDERREQMAIVHVELDRLKRLFDNVIAMASVDTHATTAELDWVHPIDIVDAARQQLRSVLQQHVVEVSEVMEARVALLDPRLTTAALAHVLQNAASYSPVGSLISIDVGGDAGGVTLSVRDRGPGLRGEEVDQVFDRFYRGAAGTSDRFSSGMGLAIARGLLEIQHGTIHAANHRYGGAIFTIQIPAPTRSPSDLTKDVA
jgi:two-component system sensor histidine kinase KdpD